jgi:hypothetical protein
VSLMKKFNLYLQPEQLRKLRVIGDVSLGKPDVSSLIRQAIDTFIEQQVQANPAIKRALDRDPVPRLVRSATGHPNRSPGDQQD